MDGPLWEETGAMWWNPRKACERGKDCDDVAAIANGFLH